MVPLGRGGEGEREKKRERETQGHCSTAQVYFNKTDKRMKGKLFISTEQGGGCGDEEEGISNEK